jgi:hypothetical protein
MLKRQICPPTKQANTYPCFTCNGMKTKTGTTEICENDRLLRSTSIVPLDHQPLVSTIDHNLLFDLCALPS